MALTIFKSLDQPKTNIGNGNDGGCNDESCSEVVDDQQLNPNIINKNDGDKREYETIAHPIKSRLLSKINSTDHSTLHTENNESNGFSKQF
ncbi:unnamed protein product [Schistosoma margrebowiei]|uniref:Uncharacterized protein n=1 Tax=Schistosoma margrebowiei TaxID=48269 RepID=A0A183M0N1_9TREM|nr:unnamed protein product [Schistosoma margrebowiei]